MGTGVFRLGGREELAGAGDFETGENAVGYNVLRDGECVRPASQTQNQRCMHAAFCIMRILANNLPSEAYLTDRALMLDSHGCSSKGNPTLLLNHCRALLVGRGVVLPDWKKRYKAPQLFCYPSIVTHFCAM